MKSDFAGAWDEGAIRREAVVAREKATSQGTGNHADSQEDQPEVAPFPVTPVGAMSSARSGSYLIKGLIEKGAVIMPWGATSIGKSFLVFDWAAHIATGRECWGRKVRQGGVLYFALEGERGVQNRVLAWKRENGLDDDDDFPLRVVTVPVSIIGDRARILKTIEVNGSELQANFNLGVSLVVFDTLTRALRGESASGDDIMMRAVDTADVIKAETGAAVVLVHHSGKDESKGPRGSQTAPDSADGEIHVMGDRAARTGTFTMKKNRDGLTNEAAHYELEVVVLGKDEDGDDITSCVVCQRSEDSVARKLGLSGQAEKGFRYLHEVANESGKKLRDLPEGERPASPRVPTDRLLIPVAEWRERCRIMKLCASDNPKSIEKAAIRALKEMVEKGIAQEEDGWIWFLDASGQGNEK